MSDEGKIRIIKRKATGFFQPDDYTIIKQTVVDVTAIISRASILVRAYYLRSLDAVDSPIIVVDDQLITFACSVVQGGAKAPLRGVKALDPILQNTYLKLKEVYKDIYDCDYVKTESSISHILAYSIANLVTAYKNNITSHFIKYPKRLIKCHFINKGYASKEAGKMAAIICSHYFYGKEINDEAINPRPFRNCFPPKRKDGKPLCYDIVINPWKYLQKMVSINITLEVAYPNVNHKYRKLLNPLPFHSSFIPMHIRLDTSGLTQLLMDKQRIEDFKLVYNERINMSSKGDMLSSFETLHGREAKDNAEKGAFATAFWDFLTNLKTCKQWRELHDTKMEGMDMVFDNAIVTDGVSISFQVIERSKFGRKVYGRKKKADIEEAKSPPDPMPIPEDAKLLGNDPGKKDILCFTDGVTTVRYTRGQRQQDTMLIPRRKQGLKRRRGIQDFETQALSEQCKRTCRYKSFKAYCQLRHSKNTEFKKVYEHSVFRQFKFLAYCKEKSSEDKFIQKVRNTFSKANPKSATCLSPEMKANALKETTNLVIGWGDWGKNPNLRGNDPTPGIGIRRRFESHFKTRTVNEFLTSQTCPCCKQERVLKNPSINGFERHHLLRCSNDKCKSRWWNRNVVGSYNILSKFLRSHAHPMTKPLGSDGEGVPLEVSYLGSKYKSTCGHNCVPRGK